MKLIFFIKSETVDISNYTIKNIPGSSGRLDVISRCILAALLNHKGFEKKVEIWVFLKGYGTFIFNPDDLQYQNFPKNELMLSDYFVSFLHTLESEEKLYNNPLNSIKISEMSITKAIESFKKKNICIFVLKEAGKDFLKLKSKLPTNKDILFIIGSQEDKFLSSSELLQLNLPSISIGNQSYLASSVIRLLKLHMFAL
ncbi:hypothetical protein LCGC14_0916290 [marine sediment metagenome]|uniref:tRNA/rRNA methyltransferase SpoU type domain-containing protein n=1 Tax=marine sediment metagenome TaxID=412755 RepID=A0A0F9RYX3_9ZZZZ|nr:hypothetical protein [bacterium]